MPMPKGDGGHDHIDVLVEERRLGFGGALVGQAGVVGRGLDAGVLSG